MAKQKGLSAARAELFELFEEVTARDGVKVVIAHRNSPKRAVLVSEDYLEHLEEISKRPTSSFKLIGSMKLNVDDPLAATRAEQKLLAARKLRSLAAQEKKRRR